VKQVIIERSSLVFDDFFKIEEAYLRYERFDGTMSPVVRRLSFERGDSIAALVFNSKSQRIVLVNQFRYPACKKGPGWVTEAIAGMIDGDEDPEDAARREILEETGYRARSVEYISTFYLSPGGTSERILLYYTEVEDNDKISDREERITDDEDIVTIELTLENALRRIESNEIVDAKTIIAIYWLQNRLMKDKLGEKTT
jgi:nudix-type nucleoside diphosphatase (YffH/AdpP family)